MDVDKRFTKEEFMAFTTRKGAHTEQEAEELWAFIVSEESGFPRKYDSRGLFVALIGIE